MRRNEKMGNSFFDLGLLCSNLASFWDFGLLSFNLGLLFFDFGLLFCNLGLLFLGHCTILRLSSLTLST